MGISSRKLRKTVEISFHKLKIQNLSEMTLPRLAAGLFLCTLSVTRCFAIETVPLAADTTVHSESEELREVVVTGQHGGSNGTYVDGRLNFDSGKIMHGLHAFGEADIINTLKRNSMISANSEYSTGISVEGADPSQTVFSVNGTGLFFPYRFGGVFSVFQTPHFASATFSPRVSDKSTSDFLGGETNFVSRSGSGAPFRLQVNAGLLASSVSVGVPIGRKLTVNAAGRVSYINRLYSPMLNNSEHAMLYDFADFNLSSVWTVNDASKLILESYYGHDRLTYVDTGFGMKMKMGWSNAMAQLSWFTASETFNTRHTASYTSFRNSFNIALNQIGFEMPSAISRVSVTGGWNLYRRNISLGYEAAYYDITPQYMRREAEGNNPDGAVADNAWYAKALASKVFGLSNHLNLTAAVHGSLWKSKASRTRGAINPRLTLKMDYGRFNFSVHAGTYAQYIHQVGLSEIGLASNYFIGADSVIPVQRALSFTATAEWRPSAEYTIVVSPYLKYVDGQTEFRGQILEMYDSEYNPSNYITAGHGYNTGVSVAVYRNKGPFTGSVSYSYGLTRRHSPGIEYAFRSIHDPGNRLNINVEYSLNKWTFAAAFTVASGRVYTPVSSFYIIGKNIISEYGRKNSARMPPYQRLDLSATFKFDIKASKYIVGNMVNISLINAYGHKNIEMQYFRIDPVKHDIMLKRVYSLFRFLPSVSYTITI